MARDISPSPPPFPSPPLPLAHGAVHFSPSILLVKFSRRRGLSLWNSIQRDRSFLVLLEDVCLWQTRDLTRFTRVHPCRDATLYSLFRDSGFIRPKKNETKGNIEFIPRPRIRETILSSKCYCPWTRTHVVKWISFLQEILFHLLDMKRKYIYIVFSIWWNSLYKIRLIFLQNYKVRSTLFLIVFFSLVEKKESSRIYSVSLYFLRQVDRDWIKMISLWKIFLLSYMKKKKKERRILIFLLFHLQFTASFKIVIVSTIISLGSACDETSLSITLASKL